MQPLFIGPYTDRSGVKQNVKPFMIPDEAFPNMQNAFVWRGRVRRKPGYELIGRLRRAFTATSIGNFSSATTSYNLKTLLGITETNAQIQTGFVITIGAPDNQTLTDSGTGTLSILPVDATKITSATVNYNTGVLTLTWGGVVAASAATFTGGYFPGLPAMGIRIHEDPTKINEEQTIFWDTKYAYRFTTDFEELPSTLPTTWSGTDSQQFWATNYQNTSADVPLIWVTNGVPGLQGYTITAATKNVNMQVTTTNLAPIIQAGDTIYLFNMDNPSFNFATGTATLVAGNVITTNVDSSAFAGAAATSGVIVDPNRNISGDGIRYYDGTTWHNFQPLTNGTNAVLGCLLIVPYKNRLVLLNTIEGNNPALGNTVSKFPQRARWSQLSLATGASATDFILGWRDDLPGRGNFIDAATEESIVSCGFVKDELIVYFERSTWKLVYTGNEIGPFVWQRINSELGADSTFSNVQFDAGLIALGNVGIHTSNGSQVQRIDQDIPDEVFDIHNGSDGPERVSAVRDFFQEIVYFAYPTNISNIQTPGKIFFPNKMVIYNYRNSTFSFTDDNATTMGLFNPATSKTWSQLTNFTWEEWKATWKSGILSEGFPSICFGNQQGFIERYWPLINSSAPSLMIQNIVTDPLGSKITSPQHNLFTGQWVRVSGALGITGVNGINAEVVQVVSEDQFVINTPGSGTYIGNGKITVLAMVNIPTKQFTPFWEKGKNYTLKYFDVLFDLTDGGELHVDVYVDFNTSISMTDTSGGYVLGTPTVSTSAESITPPFNLPYYQFQNQGSQIWKRFYTVATGETFQIVFSFNDDQMSSQAKNDSDVVIHAMNLFFEEAGEFY